MHRKKRNFWLLLLSILSLGTLAYLVLNYSPSENLLLITYHLSLIPVSLLLLFLFIFSLFGSVLKSKRRGFLLGLLVISYLFLRLNGLTSPFFVILLLILFGAVELFFVKRS